MILPDASLFLYMIHAALPMPQSRIHHGTVAWDSSSKRYSKRCRAKARWRGAPPILPFFRV